MDACGFPPAVAWRCWIRNDRPAAVAAPVVHLLEVAVDGRPMPVAEGAKLAPGNGRMQFRYTGIYLSAPERVRYSYRLEGLDGEWISSWRGA